MQIVTTLNALARSNPSPASLRQLLKYLGKTVPDNLPLPLSTVLASNGLAAAMWCLQHYIADDAVYAVDKVPSDAIHREMRKFSAACCRQLLGTVPDADRALKPAIEAAEAYADGRIDADALDAANMLAVANDITALSISNSGVTVMLTSLARCLTQSKFNNCDMQWVAMRLNLLYGEFMSKSIAHTASPETLTVVAELPEKMCELFLRHFCSDND
jgi:hypothetical protein